MLELSLLPWTTTAEPVFTYGSLAGSSQTVALVVSLGSPLVYAALVFCVAPLLRPQSESARRLFDLARKAHNVVMFLFSLLCCSSMAVHMALNHEFSSVTAVLCDDPPRWIMLLNVAFTFSKVYEWFDSLFLVWLSPRGANSFLHLYHHATTFWLFLLVSNLPGPLRMGLLLNGGVHTLMYAHYAWPFPKQIVPLITLSQIAQLGVVTYLWSITPSECARFASFPDKYPLEFATPYFMVPVYLVFFVHFFVKRFFFGNKKGKK